MSKIPIIRYSAGIIFLLLITPYTPGHANTTWSTYIEESQYSWYAPKSDLRDNNLYHDSALIGGINIARGGTDLILRSKPDQNFNFFHGDRLNISIWIEGDIGIEVPDFNSDYHFLLLPLTVNGTNFFELLFADVTLVENLTRSLFQNFSISKEVAELTMKYNDNLDVEYLWDLESGLLLQKTVTSPTGQQLQVVEDKYPFFRGFRFLLISRFALVGLLAIAFCVVIIRVFRKKKHGRVKND